MTASSIGSEKTLKIIVAVDHLGDLDTVGPAFLRLSAIRWPKISQIFTRIAIDSSLQRNMCWVMLI